MVDRVLVPGLSGHLLQSDMVIRYHTPNVALFHLLGHFKLNWYTGISCRIPLCAKNDQATTWKGIHGYEPIRLLVHKYYVCFNQYALINIQDPIFQPYMQCSIEYTYLKRNLVKLMHGAKIFCLHGCKHYSLDPALGVNLIWSKLRLEELHAVN